MATLDIFDLWKGWWIPGPVARRVPRAVLPGSADVGRYSGDLVHTSPTRLQDHWCAGIRRSAGIETWLGLFVVLPAAVLAMLALAGLVLTVHPSAADDPEFARENSLQFFSFSAGLASAALLWLYRSHSLYRRRTGVSLPLTSAVDLARLLRSCWKAGEGSLPLLALDQQVTRFSNRLGWFAQYGVAGERRRSALRPHLARVQHTLETQMSKVLRDGPDALPQLVRLLSTLLDRSVQGRWMGLLDEVDLPEETAGVDTADEEGNDRWVVLGGGAAAAVIVVAAVAAGLPASAVAPAALTALIGPAVMWGSQKLESARQYQQTMRASLNGAPAGPDTTTEPAAAPTR
ncbi:hypothetical protein ACIHEJ_40400 [Streptomyces sp. NPDC052301]|uniref:hypothetical protein n=1 Tax=Streptomyces sp. NPDC052301 TaxID=3365687 RepID=UPI0037D3895E